MKKIEKKSIIISVSSLAAGVAITLLLVMLITVQPLKKENKSINSKLKSVNAKYSTTQSELKDTNENLENATSENSNLKTDISAKEQEITKVNQEIDKSKKELEANKASLEASKKELATNKAELDKAKVGIQKLKDLDGLFTKFDTQSEELSDILNNYYNALNNGDYASASSYELQYDSKASDVENTYNSITSILNDFRNGKY